MLFNKSATVSDQSTGASSGTTAPSSFANLAEMANYRLKDSSLNGPVSQNIAVPSSQNARSFVIPRLNASVSPSHGSSSDGLTPHEMSLKKIMEMRKLNISGSVSPSDTHTDKPLVLGDISNFKAALSVNPPKIVAPLESPLANTSNFVVDLSAALFSKDDKITVPAKFIPEVFEMQFVDCEPLTPAAIILPNVTQDCEIDISHVLDVSLANRTNITSPFGKVLCSRFRCKRMPYVSHEFQPKHQIVPFAFNTINKIRKINVRRDDL